MQVNWKGVFPAVTTKFTADDKLDFDNIGKNFQAQLDAGRGRYHHRRLIGRSQYA